MKRRSLHVRDEQARAVSQVLQEARERDEYPDLESEADVFRRLLDYALENADLRDLLSEETLVLAQRERFVQEEARVRNLRTGFETRVKREFKKRFENGYSAEQLEQYAENLAREAMLLWPEAGPQDYQERREQALEYVEAVAQHAAEAAEQSAWDPLDPEEMFGSHSGLQEAEQQEQEQAERDAVVEHVPTACSLLNDGTSPSRAERRLVSVHGVPERLAGLAVERALDRDGVVPDTGAVPAAVRPDGGEPDE
jgi:hypothetical protein